MFYFFMMATVLLIKHNIIKDSANKGKKKGDDDYIVDWNIHLLGGVLAYMAIYCFMGFYTQTFFGWELS